MSRHPFHDIAIVGAYNTVQGRRLEGETSTSLTIDAVKGALADAGLTAADVDGFNVIQGVTFPFPSEPDWRLPIHLTRPGPAWIGQNQSLGIGAVIEAAMAISAGLCHTALLATAQAGYYRDHTAITPWARPHDEFVECWGMYTAAQFALLARRHMHLFGTQPEHLAEVASTIRSNGSLNPAAAHRGRGPVTPEDVLSSRLIADPFHLLDCATTTEGGAGLVVTTAERARDLRGQPVYLLGAGWDHVGPFSFSCPPAYDELSDLGRRAARGAFGMAGIGREDVQVLELYDPFSFDVIQQFEAFEFCGLGEGGPFVMDGRIRLGGQFPIGTDGGTMAFSHPGIAQLTQKVVEGVAQIRGLGGERQVKDTQIALVSGPGFVERHVLLLGAEPAS